MNVTSQNASGEANSQAMVQVDMEFKTFLSAWLHCDYVSTYLARMVSHNRSDSVRHANLFSSALNELLEIAFRTHHHNGELSCRISRQGETDTIELRFPCMLEERQFYQEAISQIARSEARERYLHAVSGDLAPSREIVLLELAIDYGATLRIEDADADAITLVMDLALEDLSN